MTRLRNIAAGALAIAVALATASTAAQAQKKVTVVLDWIGTQPHHMGYWLAKDKGWFAEGGLDVTIQSGRGSGQVVQFVTAGTAQFGHASASALVQAVAKQNAPLKMVAVFAQKDITAIGYFESTGIKSPKDFEGRKLGVVAGTIQHLLLRSFAKAAGFDLAKVDVINTDLRLYNQQWIGKQFDVSGNYLVGTSTTLQYEAAGEKVKALVLSDYLPLIGHGTIVQSEMIAKDPAAVGAFVKAAQRAWAYMIADPEKATLEAARIMAANIEKTDPPEVIAKFALEVVPSRMVSDSTRGKPVGWSEKKDWDAMIDVIAEFDRFPRRPSFEELVENRFVQQ